MIFLDTSGLLCLHDADEGRHDQAMDYFGAADPKFTHGEVLSEFVTLCQARGLPRRPALGFARSLLEQPDVRVVWVDARLHRAALDLLDARPDKRYSLCDAISFVVLRHYGITESLTTDHHFEQEGFVRLLRP